MRLGRVRAPEAGAWAVRAAGIWTLGQPAFVADAGLLARDGRIVAVGPWREVLRGHGGPIMELPQDELAPGLVNAHVHLGLSHAQGRTQGGQGFVPWVRSLLPSLGQPFDRHSLCPAVNQLLAAGTAAVGEIVNLFQPEMAASLAERHIDASWFVEGFGWQPGYDPPEEWAALAGERLHAAGHALYSTSPERLRAAKAWAQARGRRFSLHLAEDPAEVEFCRTGEGPLAAFSKAHGILPRDFAGYGASPVQAAHGLGLLGPETLAVHAVQVDAADVATLAATGTQVVLCPRSNAFIGVGRPPLADYLAAGARVSLATDGLCSVADLDLWNEVRFCQRELGVALPLETALLLICHRPATALGLETEYGRLLPGQRAVCSLVPEDLRSGQGRWS